MKNRDAKIIHYDAVVKTPFATLGLLFNNEVLERVDYLKASARVINPKTSAATMLCQQISDYCKTMLTGNAFDIKLQSVGTPFQKKVWRQIVKIPYGQVKTYGAIAKTLKTSPRAVGNACRANPIVLVVPCHRVVSASGMGGYSGQTSGSAMKIKTWLLEHEKKT